jgi:hypothetical protein
MNTSRSVHSKEGYRRFYWTHFTTVESEELPSSNPERTCRRSSGLKLEVVLIPLRGQPASHWAQKEKAAEDLPRAGTLDFSLKAFYQPREGSQERFAASSGIAAGPQDCRSMKTARRRKPPGRFEETVSRIAKGQAGMPVLPGDLDLHEDDNQGEERERLDEDQAENHRRADGRRCAGIASHAFARRRSDTALA